MCEQNFLTLFSVKYSFWYSACDRINAKERKEMISSFFTADYRDGRVIFGGKSYPAGVFATHLLNQFYVNDTAAQIAVFRDDLNYHIITQLSNGYLNITEFVKTGANTLEALKALPKLRPFDGLNIEEIRNSVTTLFTAETGQKICGYFAEKAKLSLSLMMKQ